MECIWDPALLRHSDHLPLELIEVIRRGANEQYLEVFTKTALDPRHTYILFAHCEDIFAHICATLHDHGTFSSAIATLGRVVPLGPYLQIYAERLLSSNDVDLPTLDSQDENLQLLLGIYRLLNHDRRSFVKYVNLAQVESLLRHRSRPVVYLAIRIMQLHLCGADDWFERMVVHYLGADSPNEALDGPWDELVIDYRFLSLWEEHRMEKARRLISDMKQHDRRADGGAVRQIPKDLFALSSALVGDVLLPTARAQTPSQKSYDPFVVTPTSLRNLNAVASSLRTRHAILFTGLAGSGKTTVARHAAHLLGKLDDMVTLHLNEQSDAKLLIGLHTTGESPGSFVWRPGVLTTAVQEGRWVLIEDIDRAPNEIIGTLLPLIEKRELRIPNRKQTLYASSGFRLMATMRSAINHRGEETAAWTSMLGARHWRQVSVASLPADELATIGAQLYPSLSSLLPQLIAVYERLQALHRRAVSNGQSSTGIIRPASSRDLFKWCSRVSGIVKDDSALTGQTFDDIFLEAIDCFIGSLPTGRARSELAAVIAEELRIDPQRRDYLMMEREPRYAVDESATVIGRFNLGRQLPSKKAAASQMSFASNPHTIRVLECVAAAVVNHEPLLLVGETGVGKTSSVQHLATHLGKKLVPFNLSQQSESSDLLGGFKPISVRSIVTPLKDEFDELFAGSFSLAKNQMFLDLMGKQMAKSNWKAVCKLWREALKMVDQRRDEPSTAAPEKPSKRRKIDVQRPIDFKRWSKFAEDVADLEKRISTSEEAVAFKFVEGNLVKAVRNGDWVLLDEINLAAPDTLESIVDLLYPKDASVLLTEAGNVERIEAHPDFRIFAAMNPATDIGKRDLPPGVRSRFTEVYVESPDQDIKSLQSIVRSYIHYEASTDKGLPKEVSTLYQKIQALSRQNKLVDGAGQRPHFSLRTLTRTLSYAKYVSPLCNLRRALYEGFQMSFLTFLDSESAGLVQPLLQQYLLGKLSNIRAELQKALRKPVDSHSYVQGFPGSKHWVRQGSLPLQDQPHYILTPFIRSNMENLVRAASTRRFPVLIQGPTSSGKTSMIEYLAKRTGHEFVRINNHEHTDLQEYLGTYVSGVDGRLHFQEGVLVKALREGHWLVLDELNLAPSEVLEALNRLLDDNRELLIPETQQIVRPHENFMLFATQNPAGIYGGRKTLSRAFRNRFLELHFDDIPIDELQEILHRRTHLPESRCKRIVSVYRELSVLRNENRLFEQKSFATLRDLFRWALRPNDTIEDLAANGFMLLAERVRKAEERALLRQIIEKVMSKNGPKVKISDGMYGEESSEFTHYSQSDVEQGVVWTKAMRRLYVLISRAISNNEPVLLVGETGCGKTTVCQILATAMAKSLYTINAHLNTETGDLIGSQRPLRNRASIEAELRHKLLHSAILQTANETDEMLSACSTDALLDMYDRAVNVINQGTARDYLDSSHHQDIQKDRSRFKALFEWADGSLVEAMKQGAYFLLDEISLADDSVLERINSVLEPDRSILLAEKGSLDSFVKASSGFQFFATMNPGGDYGKRELSPALRNRFTEIWVPSLDNDEDVLQIVKAKLAPPAKHFASTMVSFASWFKSRFNTSANSSTSIRDALAWVNFVNASAALGEDHALVHGAAMVYIDTLGANPAGLMSSTGDNLTRDRHECLRRLEKLTGIDITTIYSATIEVALDGTKFSVGPFDLVRRQSESFRDEGFSFDAPTTRVNAMRTVRALQLPKPVMLEGSPGVGKTALVLAVADAAGVPLTRINLSEQTDLIDLFGSDVPVEGSDAGTFAWRDAPFLRAMKRGDWVLLDEMNLASQSVLEGLNACLDHRGEIFVPELGQVFHRHPDFRLFAAQNPHHQGGGRKGLPASFVNRFTVVYADAFQSKDLILLCRQRFSSLALPTIERTVRFVDALEQEITRNGRFAISGRPWEFNLRDISRWLSLEASDEGLLSSATSWDLVDLLFSQRFRSAADRAFVEHVFDSVFDDTPLASDLFSSISSSSLQLGLGILARNTTLGAESTSAASWRPNTVEQLRTVQSVMLGIQQKWPVILIGGSGAGKTALIERLAAAVGARISTVTMNADTDVMDLIGGYEQSDPDRENQEATSSLRALINSNLPAELLNESASPLAVALTDLDSNLLDSGTLDKVIGSLPTVTRPLAETLLRQVRRRADVVNKARFEWIDGTLVDALQQGRWLVLDHANLASASVLDRLNSLLEPNGTLIINEHSGDDGSPRVIIPHPGFRILLTLDPRYGELSRAMRNRGLEIYMPTSERTEQPVFLCDSLLTESAMARYRQVKALATSNVESLTQSFEDVLNDHFGMADMALLPRLQRQLAQGLYFNDSAPEVLAVTPWSLVNGMQHLVAFYDGVINEKQLPADAASVQTFHPLNNQALIRSAPHNTSKAFSLAFIYDMAGSLISMRRMLYSIESDQALLAQLRRNERSLKIVGHNHGSVVANALREMLDVMIKAVQGLTGLEGPSLADEKDIFRKLASFWVVLSGLARDASFDAATLRAMVSVGQVTAGPTDSATCQRVGSPAIKQALSLLDASKSRGRGIACAAMWRAMKPRTPTSRDSLEGLMEFQSYAGRFDDACRTFELSLQVMVDVRRSFVQSLGLASGDTNSIEVSADLERKFSSVVWPKQSPRRPHFLLAFRRLQEHFTWLAHDFSQSFPENQIMTLEIFAGMNAEDTSSYQPIALECIQKRFQLLNASTWTLRNAIQEAPDHMEFPVAAIRALRTSASVSLDHLDLLRMETEFLAQFVASKARAIGTSDAPPTLRIGLRSIMSTALDVLSSCENDELASLAQKLLSNLSETRPDVPNGSPEITTHASHAIQRAALYLSNTTKYLGTQGEDVSEAGKAWTSLGIACLELYVPDVPFDPVLGPQIKRRIHDVAIERLTSHLGALRLYKSRWNGNTDDVRTTILQSDIARLGPGPSIDEVYRPAQSRLPLLQQEFDGLMRLLKGLEIDSMPLTSTLLENLIKARERLQRSYKAYSDFTRPVVAFIDCILIGHRLSTRASIFEHNQLQSSLSDLIPFVGGSIQTWISDTAFINAMESSGSLSHRACWLHILACRAHSLTLPEASFKLQKAVHDQFALLYQEWASKLNEDQKKDAAKSNLYKFRGDDTRDEPTDDEVEDMFPTTEATTGDDAITARNYVHDLAADIARFHRAIYHSLEWQETGASPLMHEWSSLTGYLEISARSVSTLPSILDSLHSLQSKFSTAPESLKFNIYTDSNVFEITKLLSLVNRIEGRFSKLHEAWSEHATPVEALRQCEQIKAISHAVPLTRVLPLVEKLHATAHEWQKIASKEYSVNDNLDDIVTLIVNWRRLELASWAGLFERERLQREKDAASWWFVAYESIIAASQDINDIDNMRLHTTGLLETLSAFLLSSGLGEFTTRIKILSAFAAHLDVLKIENGLLSIVCTGVSNFVAYFGNFESSVTSALARGRTDLEKKVTEIIQLASWKDRNIDVLRQSARSSHKKLLRLVRQYRALLAQPVAPILAGGIPERQTRFSTRSAGEVGFTPSAIKHESTSGFLMSWNDRPQRFRSLDRTVGLLTSKSDHAISDLDGSQQLESFIEELGESVLELQKATPSVLTEENKAMINHLKTRKRLLLADTLKSVRLMGFQSTVSQNVRDQQSTLEAVLSNVSSLNQHKSLVDLSMAEYHFNRLIGIMPSVRECGRKHSEDLLPSEIARCISLQESMLHLSRQQRIALDRTLDEYVSLANAVDCFENFGRCDSLTTTWQPAHDMRNIRGWLTSLQSVFQLTQHLLRAQSSLASLDYSDVKTQLESHATKLDHLQRRSHELLLLPTGIHSNLEIEFSKDCKSFQQDLVSILDRATSAHPETTPVLSHVHKWLMDFSSSDGAPLLNGNTSDGAERWVQQVMTVLDTILGSVQDMSDASSASQDRDLEKNWVIEQHHMINASVKALHVGLITDKLSELLSTLHEVQSEEALADISSICKMLCPIIRAYQRAARTLLTSSCDLHTSTNRTAYKLASIFVQLANQGFCTPAEKSQSNESQKSNVESGTGLGEGEGAEDISKDIKDDEDLSELAQEAKEQRQDGNDIDDVEDAVDMANEDLEGEVSDGAEGSDEEGGGDDDNDDLQQDLDEEQGQVHNSGPSAVDEKMWNGDEDEAQDEKEGDSAQGESKKEDIAAGGEGEEGQADAPTEEEQNGVDEPEDESETVGQDSKDQVDTTAQDQDNLELPEDINMDGQDRANDEESDFGDISDGQIGEGDQMDIDETEMNEDVDPASPPDGEDEAAMSETELTKDAGEDADLEHSADQNSDVLMQDDQQPFEDQVNDDLSADIGNGPEKAADGSKSQGANNDDVEDAEDQETASQEDSGAAGGQSKISGDDETTNESSETKRQRELPFKQLGDLLDDWYKQNRKIEDASEPQQSEPAQERDVDMSKTKFEHVQEGDTSADTQALGVASADQSTALNEEKALSVNEDEPEDLPFQDDQDEQQTGEDQAPQDRNQIDPSKMLPPEPQSNVLVGQDNEARMDVDMSDDDSSADNKEFQDVDEQLTNTHISHDDEVEMMSREEALHQWARHEDSTRNLSLMLTEHLRLILHPTQATKMRGDYRTGKRLNIKRIIPYIASSFKRDKIWMRRSVPSKRAYQVMLAIDDSKSMSESGSRELAFDTLALVARSLSMLEVGELSIVGFGENVNVARDFATSFGPEAGAEVLQNFTFTQRKTNVRKLLEESIELFRSAKLKATGSASDLWQLQLIISDGVCDDHPAIRQLVRQAQEEQIMIVFIVVDAAAAQHQQSTALAEGAAPPPPPQQQQQSILDLQTAEFVKDAGGEMQLKMVKYLDTFPFKYYLIVRDVTELPAVLAGALRQWFSEVVGVGGY